MDGHEMQPEAELPETKARTTRRSRVRMLERFASFLDEIEGTIYPEPDNALSAPIIDMAIAQYLRPLELDETARVLDVGCGSGVALRRLSLEGLRPMGVTLGPEAEQCRKAGFEVLENDMSDIDLPDTSIDLVFARHVLEHSVAPLFTLREWRRLLVPGGHLYVEVPCPDTSAQHESNPNHFSVFGNRMWQALFQRAGLEVLDARSIDFEVPCGPDSYWSFFLRRPL